MYIYIYYYVFLFFGKRLVCVFGELLFTCFAGPTVGILLSCFSPSWLCVEQLSMELLATRIGRWLLLDPRRGDVSSSGLAPLDCLQDRGIKDCVDLRFIIFDSSLGDSSFIISGLSGSVFRLDTVTMIGFTFVDSWSSPCSFSETGSFFNGTSTFSDDSTDSDNDKEEGEEKLSVSLSWLGGGDDSSSFSQTADCLSTFLQSWSSPTLATFSLSHTISGVASPDSSCWDESLTLSLDFCCLFINWSFLEQERSSSGLSWVQADLLLVVGDRSSPLLLE